MERPGKANLHGIVALYGDDVFHPMGILSRTCRVIVTETGLLLAFLSND